MTRFTIHSTTFNEDIIFQFSDTVVNRLSGYHCVRQFNANMSNMTLQTPTIISYGTNYFTFGTDTDKTVSDSFSTSGYVRLSLRAGEINNEYSDVIEFLQTLSVTVDGTTYNLSDIPYFTTFQNSDYPVPVMKPFYQEDYWGKTFTIDIAAAPVDKATFSNDLANCTLSNPQAEYESETTYSTYINADSHYFFKNTPKIRYYKNALLQEVYFSKVTDFSYFITFNDKVDNNTTISIIADSGIVGVVKVNVSYIIDNEITLLDRPTELTELQLPRAFILQKPSSREYNETVITYYDRNNVLQEIQGTINNNECTFIISNAILFNPNSTLTIIANLKSNERNIIYHVSNCTQNISPTTYTLGTSIDYEFTVNTGFFFNSYVSLSYIKNGSTIQITGYGTETKGYLTLEINDADLNTPIQIYATAIKQDSEIVKLYNNIIGVYKVSKRNIEDIAHARYSVVDTEYIYHNIDLGEYIKSLKRYFFDIYTLGRSTIKLGNSDLPTVADVVENSIYEIDLGTHLIPKIYNTENDFNDIEIIAMLPYSDLITLDYSFIGRNINIIYKVNIVSDDCKILFIDDDTDEILKISYAKVSLEIPYKTLDVNSDYLEKINKDFQGYSLINNFIPKIIMRSKKIIPQLHNQTDFIETLNNLSGFVSIADCDLSGICALKDEIDLIESELKNGIILDSVYS